MTKGATLVMLGLIAGCARNDPIPGPAAPPPLAASPALPGRYVWIEAESPSSTSFGPAERNPFAPLNEAEAEVLSGGKWIGADGKRAQTLFAEYEFSAPEEGSYQLFARKFWKHGPYRWRIDSQPWQEVGPEVALLDSAGLRQYVEANWTFAGTVSLDAGPHTLRIESTTGEGAIAFDAFIVTMDPFMPRGKLKPGEKFNRAPQGYFAFEPDADSFGSSPIDLRSLNEDFAGENGFIQARGEEFVHGGNGEPVRFWAQNTGTQTLFLDDASLALFARSMAKQGVNLVRLQGPPWGADWRHGDAAHARRVQRFVAALKKEGIYTCLSIYFPLDLKPQRGQLGGYSGNQRTFATLFFSPELQTSYRNWWSTLLTTPDLKTGKTLREDPAVAMLEMVNEDSYFFWTFTPYESIPAGQMEILEHQFGEWLAQRHGSLQRAFQVWGAERKRGDEPSAGRAGFITPGEMATVKSTRVKDTVAFLAESQRRFYDETYAFLKKDLLYPGMVYASNWITANPQVLGPIDKWTNSGGDFMDRHGYFDTGHEGEGASYSIRKGHTFRDVSALTFPGKNFSLPVFDLRYGTKPSTITEINWTPPNRLRADLPLVAAAYASLQGTDAIFFFSTGSPSWEDGTSKFSLRTPVIAGQFPATAYMYRKGLIQAAPVAVEANLTLRRLLDLQGAPLAAPQNLDGLRAADLPGQPGKVARLDSIDPLAFLVGKVGINFTTEDQPSSTINLGRYINRDEKVVVSATGELKWDYGNGLVTVNAPMAQGLTGFLGKARLVTADVEATVPLDYGTVLLVALDDKPISHSGRILLQVMSQESVYGFRTSGWKKLTITDLGSAPLVVRKLRGTVSLKRADAAALTVTALDANGYPRQKLGNASRIDLLEDAFYYIIEK